MGSPETGNPASTIPVNCYPNPARDACYVSFFLPAPANLNIINTDVNGSTVLSLGEKYYPRGNHVLGLDGNGLQRGLYHVILITATDRVVQKLVISR